MLPEWSWVKSMPAVKLMACSRISYATKVSIELEQYWRLKSHTVSPMIAYRNGVNDQTAYETAPTHKSRKGIHNRCTPAIPTISPARRRGCQVIMGVSVLPSRRKQIQNNAASRQGCSTYLYAFQLVRKISLTFCLCVSASQGRNTHGLWMFAASPLDTHARATTEVRSDKDTMTTSGRAANPQEQVETRQERVGQARWARSYIP